MRHIIRLVAGLSFAVICASAHAQFGFKLPSLGGNSNGNSQPSGINLSSVADNVSKIGKNIDEPEEIHIGQDFATTLLGAKPLLADEHMQRYVNALGHWLALQTERPDLPWTFAVLDDPGFNAFATPGGYIFVTRGLVQRMQNESELAGVLAHEIGHVLRKHYLKAVQHSAVVGLVGDLAGGVGGGNAQLKGAALSFVKDLYSKGLDKEDEFEADRIGVVVATRAGYDPFGLPAVLQILQEQSANDSNFSLLLKTHPAPADRLDRLDKLMKNQFDTIPGVAGLSIADRLKEY